MNEVPVLWLLARASGLTANLFLTMAVVLGIAAGARSLPAWWPRFLTQGLHRGAAITALGLLIVHVVALVLDPFVELMWLDLVVPFRAGYKPLWSGLGTAAVDVLILVVLTSVLRLRLRLGPKLWRAIHLTAYSAWGMALLHGLGAGTDTQAPMVRAFYAASLGLVMASMLVRAARKPVRVGRRLVATGASR